jgi:cytochrome b pre-mRNA-processing protein 3
MDSFLNALARFAPWRRKHHPGAEKLYAAIVARARLPVFYQSFGVPDTLEGRFSVLSLHLFALLHRLRDESGEASIISQELSDIFAADMETVLREIGVGDLSIPKKVRGIAAKSAALLQGYEIAFTANEDHLAERIEYALPLDGEAAKAAAKQLASYIKNLVAELAEQPIAALTKGKIEFPYISDDSEIALREPFL